ncbi:hypothetical protein BDW62DRAFT_194050 [Aspergillus aurantiobrunneus]
MPSLRRIQFWAETTILFHLCPTLVWCALISSPSPPSQPADKLRNKDHTRRMQRCPTSLCLTLHGQYVKMERRA